MRVLVLAAAARLEKKGSKGGRGYYDANAAAAVFVVPEVVVVVHVGHSSEMSKTDCCSSIKSDTSLSSYFVALFWQRFGTKTTLGKLIDSPEN